MSIIRRKQAKTFEKINNDYMDSPHTLQYCCNKHGITIATYYNIKRRMGSNESTEKSTMFTEQSGGGNRRTSSNRKKTDEIKVEFIKTSSIKEKPRINVDKLYKKSNMSSNEATEYRAKAFSALEDFLKNGCNI